MTKNTSPQGTAPKLLFTACTALALLTLGAPTLAQTPKKPTAPLAKIQQAKLWPGDLSNHPFSGSGGSLAVGVNGSDDCTTAPAISGSGDFAFDSTGATTGSEGQSQTTHINNDIWWEWTADITGIATLSTCDQADFDTGIAVYSGAGCPSLDWIAYNDDGTGCTGFSTYLTDVAVSAGSSYMIQLGGWAVGETGTGTMSISIVSGLSDEDDCANPAVIAGEGSWAYSTLAATTGSEGQNEALCDKFGSIVVAKDLWYEWTSTADGFATVQTCGLADHDTKIAAYHGSGCPTDGTALACNDDTCGLSSMIQFSVTNGGVYTLQIGCYNEVGGSGSIQIDISGTGGTANDDCANAEAITGEGVFTYDNTTATTDGPSPTCPQAERDVWFAWTSPGTYGVEVSTCGHSNLDTLLVVYDGAPCSGAVEIACNDDSCAYQSQLIFSAVTGSTYWIRAGNYPGSTPGPGAIEITADIVDPCGESTGPDVIVGNIPGTMFWGVDGSRAGYSFAATACNVGDMEMGWWANTNVHPVIAQNMYRIEDGRFEQLGMSWLKHGWASATESYCCTCQNPNNSQVTGVGCADTYGAGANGGQGTMGPRWEVNPYTGEFPFPYADAGLTGSAAYKRLSVEVPDLDPTLHPNARFIAEVQYIQPEDSQYGNQMDNVSWRELTLGTFAGGSWDLDLQGETAVSDPAIFAWQAETGAHIDTIDISDEGRFHIGSQATQLSPGIWRYDYVLYNQNFARGLESLELPLNAGVTIWNDTFHAPPHHSGDPQANSPWAFTQTPTSAEWRTHPFSTHPNANAVVWGKAHTLSFLSDQAPTLGTATVALFDSGTAGLPTQATAEVHLPEPACGITRHCTPAPNSTGTHSTLHWYGPSSISSNNSLLYATNLPPGTPGLFYYGTTPIEVPFGDGFRCAGGDTSRLNPALFASPQGDIARPLNFTTPPLSNLTPGDTLTAQLWYRDIPAAASGFNLSDALTIILCP